MFGSLLNTRCLAELIGSALLVLLRCLISVLRADEYGIVQTGLLVGVLTSILQQSTRNISGGYLNPAITIAAYLFQKIGFKVMLSYAFVQFLGSIIGFWLFDFIFYGIVMECSVCSLMPLPTLTSGQVFAIECVLTSILIISHLAIWDERNIYKSSLALMRTATMMALILAGGEITGAILNPGLSFAYAVMADNCEHFWTYFNAQLLPSVIMPLVWKLCLRPKYFVYFARPIRTGRNINNSEQVYH